jgi:ABC-type nickel/cobalt efflux system permease component RcnA
VRLTALAAAGVAVAALAWLWASGGLAALGWRIAAEQRAMQDALAGAIAALRGGDGAAAATLVALCGAYGFLHALGPGHGKALVAGAALGSRATARRMALVALAGALAQAGVAIALVYGAFALLEVTARGLADGAVRWLTPAGDLAVAAVGAWLLARGLGAWRAAPAAGGGGADACRGHRHGPSAQEAARAESPAALLALVAGMAVRPCTGAIFVLVIAWRMGAPEVGAAGVLAMGLGVAAFTTLVAWAAVRSRELAFGPAAGAVRLLGPGLQVAAGGVILALGGLALVGRLAA